VKRALLLALALASQSCAPAGPCDYRQLALDGEEGLDLTADEHGVGWMQSSCFSCHQAWDLHPEACVDEIWLGVIEGMVDHSDTYSCTLCHGMNGLTEQEWVDGVSGASP